MNKSFVLLASFASVSLASNVLQKETYESLFFDHVKQYSLKIDGEEYAKRVQIFADNYDQIEAHNSQNLGYTLGLNQFSHMTLSEFHDFVHLGGTRPAHLRKSSGEKVHSAPLDTATLPAAVDWVSEGAVTEVKNQGNCGSCWAFATVASLEGAYYLKTGNLLEFAEQQLVSCDDVDAGCNGGWMEDAYTWIQQNKGLTTEDQYPYTSGDSASSGTCVASGYTNVADSAPSSFTDVTTESVDAMMSAVAQQPVAIAIQANQLTFQSYKSGVFTGRCGTNLDHGVTVVGYGTDDGVDYWKVKNSWGTTWGEGGYIRISKDSTNKCGVLSAGVYPNL